jgi:glycosyltransferase involved in cell wall biosynthesis
MILLLGNYSYDQQESMQRFAAMLRDGLAGQGVPVEMIHPEPLLGRLRPSASGLGKWLGYVDKFVLFPLRLRRRVKALKKAGPLVVHVCDHSSGPYCRYLQDVPHLVTCHDVLALRSARGDFPENPTGFTGRLYQQMILAGLRKARMVACVSAESQNQFLELSGLPKEKTSVIENGLNYPYSPLDRAEAATRVNALLEAGGHGEFCNQPFLLHVGGNQWYKNRVGLLAIYSELLRKSSNTTLLFLVGKPLPDSTRSKLDSQTSSRVIEFHHVNNEELRALYSTAECLVFPSKYEGFGWPLAEAQACGCRVITTNRPPMTEVAGKSAVFIDPAAPQEAAAAIGQLLQETPEEAANRIEEGFANVQRFDPETMIRSYLALYEKLLTNHAR